MTNSSPEDPQNPIPERRRRPATGVTFDEMIGIIVALTTIGAILFWSLSGKKDSFANNFSLGRDSNFSLNDKGNNLLSSNAGGAGIFSIGNAGSDINNRQGDFEQQKSRARKRRENLSLAKDLSLSTSTASSKRKSDQFSEDFLSPKDRKSPQFGSVAKLAPLAGVATLPALKTGANENKGDGTQGEISPDKSNGEDKEDSQATAPDKSNGADQADSQATAPDKSEVPNDVEASYWAYPFVKQMSDQKLVADFAEDQNFEPDKLITRASMAKLISQAFETQPEIKGVKKFKDITDKNAIADIDKAVRTGFMQGYSDEEFRPQENIPRYQVLVTLATGLGLKPSQNAEQVLQKFGDGGDMPDWAKKQVAAAAESGLIVNPPNIAQNSLKPQQSATRGEVAAMIHQALVQSGKLKPLKSKYILQP